MEKIGKVLISFDCEGKWGMIDERQSWIDNKLTDKNLYHIYEFILDILEKNNLRATFGFVGAMLESETEFRDKVKKLRQGTSHKIWIEEFYKKYENNSEGYFLPELMKLFKDSRHELATHGYCHIPFDRLSEEEAIEELSLVKSQMSNLGISYSSIIYPRNKISHTKILSRSCIARYRDFPNHLNINFIPKKINSLIDSLNVYKQAENLNKNSVPGGIMVHWFYGYRKMIPSSIIYKKYDNLLQDAAENKKMAHLWLHPHNLITSRQSKILFRDLCKNIGEMMKNEKLVNVTFNELI